MALRTRWRAPAWMRRPGEPPAHPGSPADWWQELPPGIPIHEPDEGGPQPGASGRRRGGLGLLVLVLLVFGAAALYGFDRLSEDHLFPGTRIGGVAIGGLSVEEARDIVDVEVVGHLREEITLVAPQFERRATAWDMGMRLDAAQIVRDAHAVQRARPFHARMWHRVLGENGNVSVDPWMDENAFSLFLGDTVERVNREPQNAELRLEGDSLAVVPHKLGRQIDREAASDRIYEALMSGAVLVDLPVEVVKPELTTASFDRAILISTGANTLKLYHLGELEKTYRVATGTGGHRTPHGQFHITAKRMNPTWYNPGSAWAANMPAFIPPGRNNPLGTRALNLSAPLIRIHGTPESGSIGSNASRGCIRMHIHEAEEIFELVEVGTPVFITG